MYVERLRFTDFRAFSGEGKAYPISLGKQITCIAGHNGIGKTTVLAALSNCGELKTSVGRHLNGRQFRGEYSDLIKGDRRHDTTGKKVTFDFAKHNESEILEVSQLDFRATFQNRNIKAEEFLPAEGEDGLYERVVREEQVTRYRLIPSKTEARPHEKKVSWPTYYLGLSRLYPVGEALTVKGRQLKLSQEDQEALSAKYKGILSMPEEVHASSILRLSDAPNKVGAGMETENYGFLSNSAGQDNLGQILVTILSFKKLKEKSGDYYNGGLLLIDELDATLHPAAQAKLFDYLKRSAKELDLQIVFTTHSISLINHVRRTAELSDKNKAVKLLYFSNSRGGLEIIENPSADIVENDLKNTYQGTREPVTIPILMEDQVAQNFVKWLLDYTENNLNLRPMPGSMSWQQICQLISTYWEYFFNSLVVLDPDVSTEENKMKVTNLLNSAPFRVGGSSGGTGKYFRNILFLPGNEPIETQMWECISSLDAGDEFYFFPEVEKMQIVKRSFIDEYCEEMESADKKLEFHKKWFTIYVPAVVRPAIYRRWFMENQQSAKEFVKNLKKEYEKIATSRDLNYMPNVVR